MPVRIYLSLSLILLVFLIISCSEEKPDYPVVQTAEISRIDDKNVIFTARILNNNGKINEYGFKWFTSAPMNTGDPYMVSYIGEPGSDYFESHICSSMQSGVNYFLQAFVKTSSEISYGRVVPFEGLGCEPTIVSGFKPETVSAGGTLTIWGKNFGYRKSDVGVSCVKTDFTDGMGLTITKFTNDTILVTVPDVIRFSTAYVRLGNPGGQYTLPGILHLNSK
jgi:hypothetical protein